MFRFRSIDDRAYDLLMPDILKNTYTLIAAIVTVCTLGSFGGVSLYIIQQGFADQKHLSLRVSELESITLSKSEQIKMIIIEQNRIRDRLDSRGD